MASSLRPSQLVIVLTLLSDVVILPPRPSCHHLVDVDGLSLTGLANLSEPQR
ncbi:MAG: hypothetical protein WBF08_00480 [Candidatus Bathyarchaeia archaeon]